MLPLFSQASVFRHEQEYEYNFRVCVWCRVLLSLINNEAGNGIPFSLSLIVRTATASTSLTTRPALTNLEQAAWDHGGMGSIRSYKSSHAHYNSVLLDFNDFHNPLTSNCKHFSWRMLWISLLSPLCSPNFNDIKTEVFLGKRKAQPITNLCPHPIINI